MTPIETSQDGEIKTPAMRVAEFAGSDMFRKMFREGMDLVEETAAYLDGPGREDAKRLGRSGALSYAAESMALTTQLMQSASWLLAQRAVAEGDMSPAEAADGKYRLAEVRPSDAVWPAGDDPCPARLSDLVKRGRSLYERLHRLDTSLFAKGESFEGTSANPVQSHLTRLESAFGARR